MDIFKEYDRNVFTGQLKCEYTYNCNDKLHNENGPAKITYLQNGNIYKEEYFIDGKRHREDGPAVIDHCNKYGNMYFYENIQISVKRIDYTYSQLYKKIKLQCSKKISRYYSYYLIINMNQDFSKNQKRRLLELNNSRLLMFKLCNC